LKPFNPRESGREVDGSSGEIGDVREEEEEEEEEEEGEEEHTHTHRIVFSQSPFALSDAVTFAMPSSNAESIPANVLRGSGRCAYGTI
tara:strand:- start:563 stop:826 length:264 start_codon:yes stop_codon:yes gene_type:complete